MHATLNLIETHTESELARRRALPLDICLYRECEEKNI